MTTLFRLPAVVLATGLSRSAIARLEAAGQFPQRVRLSEGGRVTAWRSDEIQQWIESRPRALRNEAAAA